MPEFIIRWQGTVSGVMFIEAETLEEAFFKAENKSSKYIAAEGEPSGWEIDEEWTRMDYEDEENETKKGESPILLGEAGPYSGPKLDRISPN